MSVLKIELHCHVKLFGRGVFRPAQLRRRLNWARRLGLSALAVTEHFDVPDFWEICRHLKLLCANGSGGLRWGELTVLTGAEVTVEEGGDILLIGSVGALQKLENRLGCRRAGIPLSGIFPPFRDFLDASEDLGFLRIGAHPCRREKELWKLGAFLKRLDALEINAGELSLAGWVQHQAKQLGLPVVAGSDAHHWLQIGRVVNLLPEDCRLTAAGLKEALRQRQLTWQRSNLFTIFRNSN
ncbi:MAG: PHP domain-containing protein [Moorella sp. (in: Bacteria)]|nr:PHP domain-containing protein [Moorella sp. (in: firmicutes)]